MSFRCLSYGKLMSEYRQTAMLFLNPFSLSYREIWSRMTQFFGFYVVLTKTMIIYYMETKKKKKKITDTVRIIIVEAVKLNLMTKKLLFCFLHPPSFAKESS